ncbi:MAG: AraC-like DNA-binding protein [Desulforhopalus sp.]
MSIATGYPFPLDELLWILYFRCMRSELFFKKNLLPFAEMRYSRGSTVPFKPHMHRTLSIGAVDQGEVFYCVNDKKSILAPGSLAIMNPETLHACNPAADSERSYYMLYLDSDWCFKVQQSMWEVDSFVEMEEIRIDDDSLYKQYCNIMKHVINDKVYLQQKEQMLFDLAVNVFSVACRPQTIKIERRDSIGKLKILLSADLWKDVPINSVAKTLHANPYTLIRNFKAVTGITPHAYRMNCRIEQSKALLKQGKDISETALECGFFDQSHFHRHFKAMTTITPQEYKVNFVQ